MLILLVVLSMIGMLIIQQNVNGFDAYYASLTPAERTVYSALGFFDIYNSWYYNVLLLILSLNIVLASMDHFPAAWAYIRNPKKTATKDWLKAQKDNAVVHIYADSHDEAADKVKRAFAANGMKPTVSETEMRTYGVDAAGQKDFSKIETVRQVTVFGQRGKWNRIGAYIVHVSLLTLFLGHFVANQTGFDADVRMIPGDATDKIQMIQFDLDRKEKFDVQLPFTMTCTDIEQRLIDQRRSIDVTNTLDWRTQMRVDDPEYGSVLADISMNKPFNYRGYRFFQAQTIPMGSARSMTLRAVPEDGGESIPFELPRLGTHTLADGTIVEYEEFLPDFAFNAQGNPDTRTGDYNNPVAVLGVTPPGGERERVFAFTGTVADGLPVGNAKAGYRWRMDAFEKAPFAHVLSIKYDPYNGAFIAWYFGGFGLMGALAFVFFFSHRRAWAVVEQGPDGRYEITMGGHANRNQLGFSDKFKRMVANVEGREVSDENET